MNPSPLRIAPAMVSTSPNPGAPLMTWEFLLTEFRALGGVADNLVWKESTIGGKGVFPLDPALPSRLHVPDRLLVPAADTQLDEQGRLRARDAAPGDPVPVGSALDLLRNPGAAVRMTDDWRSRGGSSGPTPHPPLPLPPPPPPPPLQQRATFQVKNLVLGGDSEILRFAQDDSLCGKKLRDTTRQTIS
jgi:hypothetical protein